MCCVAAGEQLSEEEESGVDEDFDETATAPEDIRLERRKSGTKNKNAKQIKTALPRFCRDSVLFAFFRFW